MKKEHIDKLEFVDEHWKNVFKLLDQVQVRYAPAFHMRGSDIHSKWGTAYEQVINIMYWTDRLSRNGINNESTTGKTMAVRNQVHLRSIAYEMKTTPEAIHAVMLLDPDYDGEI